MENMWFYLKKTNPCLDTTFKRQSIYFVIISDYES